MLFTFFNLDFKMDLCYIYINLFFASDYYNPLLGLHLLLAMEWRFL